MTPVRPSAAEKVREELDRVLASRIFSSSPRLARMLRYIVEKSVAGDRESLKEYSIGLDVFDRSASFDPKADSIVRSTARQLRLKLAEYYETEGGEASLRIRLPKGSYVAVIEDSARSVDPSRPPRRSLAMIIGAIALIAVLAVLAIFAVRRFLPPAPKTIVVLPFRDLSPDNRLSAFGEGLRDQLTSALVRTKGIEVMARASWPQVAAHSANPSDAAKAARADSVVTGSLTPEGDEVQIVVSLIDGRSGRFLWSESYRGTAADLGTIGRSAVMGIGGALGASSGALADVPAPSLPRSPEALDLYLRASELARTRDARKLHEAAPLFERLITLEPGFAPGYAAAATNYLVAASDRIMTWNEAGPRGVELARKAVALDPSLAEAHSALGLGMECGWKWQEAAAEFSRAIELDPRYAAGYYRKAIDLTVAGHFSEAKHDLQIARSLDPSWDALEGLEAELSYYMRSWDDVLKLADRRRRDNPTDEFYDNLSARINILRGQPRLARSFLIAHKDAYHRAWVRAIDGDPQGGWQDMLELRRSSSESAYLLAEFAAAELPDHRVALDWLEQSFRDHEPDLVSLVLDPIFDPIRDEPRVHAIRREINLEEWPVVYSGN